MEQGPKPLSLLEFETWWLMFKGIKPKVNLVATSHTQVALNSPYQVNVNVNINSVNSVKCKT